MTFASQDFRVRDADENLKESQAESGIPQFTVPAGEATSTIDDLVMAVVKAKDNAAVRQIGIEWCIQQSKELMQAGVPVLHYYSMGKSDNIVKIAGEVF